MVGLVHRARKTGPEASGRVAGRPKAPARGGWTGADASGPDPDPGTGRGDRGMVTLEIALGLPILMLCALVAAWVIHLGQTQARLTDAARATAREAARGADERASIGAGHRVHEEARITVTRSGGLVMARAEHTVTAPGPVLSALRRRLVAEATTVSEQP